MFQRRVLILKPPTLHQVYGVRTRVEGLGLRLFAEAGFGGTFGFAV